MILTVVVSIFVLIRYRVGVSKGMMRVGTGDLLLARVQSRDENARHTTAATMLIREKRKERGIAFGYLLSVFICALPVAFAVVFSSRSEVPFRPSNVIIWMLVFTFACIPMIATSLAVPPLRALAGLVLLTALLTALAESSNLLERLLRGLHVGPENLMSLNFLRIAGLEWLFIGPFSLLFWPRKIRGVAPITFAALFLFSLGPLIGENVGLGGPRGLGLRGWDQIALSFC